MRKILLIAVIITASGCGGFNQNIAKLTGWSKVCVEGVSYLQFTSGVTVQYDTAGKVVGCK